MFVSSFKKGQNDNFLLLDSAQVNAIFSISVRLNRRIVKLVPLVALDTKLIIFIINAISFQKAKDEGRRKSEGKKSRRDSFIKK